MGLFLAGRQSARSGADFDPGEEKNAISVAAFFGRIRAVDRVRLDRIPRNRGGSSGSGLFRVGRAHDVAIGRDRVLALEHWATTGPEIMNDTSSPKNDRALWTA